MNIFEIIKANPEFLPIIQNAVLNTLKIYSKSIVTPNTPFSSDNKTKNAIDIIGTISLTLNSHSSMLAIGFSRAAFIKLYENTFKEKLSSISIESQDLAGELINIIFQTIEPELVKKGYNFDASLPSVYCGHSIEKWKKQNIKRSFVFPFKSETGDIFFEIPELKEVN